MNTSVVLIAGALTGIGRATAVAFANEGARIVVAGRRDAEGKALEAELRGRGAGGDHPGAFRLRSRPRRRDRGVAG
jgi:NAD(P)-dependent dehydrogenase (short-subunit alcohol dehydrogenase family)